jgi:hypothetical protein
VTALSNERERIVDYILMYRPALGDWPLVHGVEGKDNNVGRFLNFSWFMLIDYKVSKSKVLHFLGITIEI